MLSPRLSLITLATTASLLVPVAASACGGPTADAGWMMTPVSMRGRFVYVNRISRRTLRHAVAERQQSVRVAVPLPREIL